MSDRIIILDFGSQYTQVIARRVREARVYSEIVKYNTPAAQIAALKPSGLILSGGPASVYSPNAPMADPEIFKLGVPVLGICYGLQIMAKFLGGKVAHGTKREYGKGTLTVGASSALFKGLPRKLQVWNSHGDKLVKLPKDFKIIAATDNCEYAALEHREKSFLSFNSTPKCPTPRWAKGFWPISFMASARQNRRGR
ncbi:glutamine-hydrolyzing GMP synthase [Oscillatoria laete-virens NRMC-F 0139]|nr:glutamine-hydrolyzing GMP synthase [Oscillatoria laete-virens NRMC-F 0139]